MSEHPPLRSNGPAYLCPGTTHWHFHITRSERRLHFHPHPLPEHLSAAYYSPLRPHPDTTVYVRTGEGTKPRAYTVGEWLESNFCTLKREGEVLMCNARYREGEPQRIRIEDVSVQPRAEVRGMPPGYEPVRDSFPPRYTLH